MEDVYRYTRSPAWEELEPEKGPASAAGIHAHVVGAVAGSGAADESSDSEAEQEGPQKLIRKVSTSGQIRSKTSIKEGLLLKQTSSFQRWKKRYFKLRGRTLYYAKDAKSGSALARWQERALRRVSRSHVCWRVLSVCWTGARRSPPPLGASGSEEGLVRIRSLIFDEVDLSDASVAESSTKNVNNSFTVITPFRRLILCAENRKEMEDWISSLKSVQSREHYETAQFNVEHFSGMHNWYACSHARPTFCNVCKDSLSGVTSHGLSCEVCKFKAHKRCAVRATNNCKWTTLASIGKDIIEDEDGIAMPHQWLEGNLPVSAKCAVCDKTCGSVLRLQDWRCLWCKAMLERVAGNRTTDSVIISPQGFWKATCPPSCASPLLVFVNSKSGDNQGVKFLRRFKQLLNPAQVFDLVNGGPHLGLRLFQKFDNFRILVCGGDGSVGWVLSEIDKLNLHKQVRHSVTDEEGRQQLILCETVKDFVAKVGKAYEKSSENAEECDTMSLKCAILNEKLDSLLQTLNTECQALPPLPHSTPPIVEEEEEDEEEEGEEEASEESLTELKEKLEEEETEKGGGGSPHQLFKSREQLMLRANSLKKAVRQIIEQAERVVDEQNAHTDDTELPSPLEFRKDSEEENRDSEKDEDTKELEAVPSAKSPCSPTERRVSRSTQSYGSFTITPFTTSKENLPVLNTRIICPGLRAGLAASIAGSSIISKMLLANIDPFGATPFIDPDLDSLEGYMEKCVMNNYFGIGLDAKISLEFNNKREEHPEKCRSRTKNMMWYGVLGTKELLQRTYKNLEQKVQLECDGQYIPLPSLQGIAVLNIPSYAGGTNFWGGTKEDDIFCAPSFDDKILEVVAVFGSMQMAVSRVIKLQHHRIAQCRTVKITILGDEGVPIQVDGEAWIQPPGVIKIQHKNRAQMLTRDRAFENTLKSWEDKLKYDKPPLRPHLYPQQSVDLATEEEAALVQMCARAAEELITRICEAAKTNGLLEQELAHAVNAASHAINKTHPKFPESLTRNTAIEVASTVKALYNETESLLLGRVSLQLDPPEEEQLSGALQSVELELGKLGEIPWLYHILQPNDEEDHSLGYGKRNSRSSMFRIVPKFKKEKAAKKTSPQSVERWGTEEVGVWLEQLSLGEYRDTFIRHDIRGSELLHLERRDLKDLGISKVGHMKRILQGTKDLAKASMVDL
ncbi:diacylglycerol kinase eta [Seriola lalandi dorsalis]|uniref:diacylglycerol kinase eta n=1 Tax=Seriola lalandi dorsalis TaxID=1841481 RepID=UPI000C6F8E08|nr:diacylglycerol kinase eta [Seriola lalandi dorsalis]